MVNSLWSIIYVLTLPFGVMVCSLNEGIIQVVCKSYHLLYIEGYMVKQSAVEIPTGDQFLIYFFLGYFSRW